MSYDYGTIINGQLFTHKTKREGDKPIRETSAPSLENHYATYEWQDTGDEIVQKEEHK